MNRIKQLRKDKNMTLVELGKQVGLPKGTLSRYENGSREPKEPTWQALANFFNVSVDYLKGAYSKEEIAKITQDEYKRQYELLVESNFFAVVSKLGSYTVDNYLISIGVIPYDIKKESWLLDKEKIDDTVFWQNSLEPIFDATSVKWLLEKPTLNANKDDVLDAVNSAMNSIINESSITLTHPQGVRVQEKQYFAKRLKFIASHTFYSEETFKNGDKELVPYINWYDTK